MKYSKVRENFANGILNKDGSATRHDLFRLVIEHLPDQIYLKDTAGHFILCNMPVALNAGREVPEDIIGKTDFDFYPEETAERFLSDERKVMGSAEVLVNHEEHYTDKKTHEVKWNLTTKVPIRDEDDTVIGLLGINRDITQMKTALLEREQTMADLERRNAELEQFTHIVSHNLRVPVANIMGLLTLVADMDTCGPEDRKTIVKGITSSINRLDAIINELNDILELREKGNEDEQRSSGYGLIALTRISCNVVPGS